ncbi:outer membrane beta-barrel protein [Niabella drilacis]|uniref:Outer membrane protein beta-barrel family protein n=1 Tax=Niabella drilacis (strain DSM 25811 / CCM 8410 / CCUG 62505 / LMG 26954 / E90) TaxID=1285928 RepID=A0A1G6WB20_NIADE|nr:TonB-dependent receptor [Niabella drilacis]SDD62979.1 Outer membrane protein beta-barrel family protein [Niabella drilacis]
MGRFFFLLFMMLILDHYSAISQEKDPVYFGSVAGKLRDSSHNYSMISATVALYKSRDSSIVSFSLTNKFGEFSFSKIPVATPLYLVATYTGYTPAVMAFSIAPGKTGINLGTLNIESAAGELKEVIVKTVPPATMNGDTLEFNADAFKLDTNAVVEDLMRKLPGVTVWADGKIMVYGKTINSVLVNGKPFFGSDAQIATQNLPKNIVDKIQVYNTASNDGSDRDSSLEMNVKLKKGKDIGRFGKLGAGYGTLKRYEADISYNLFSPKTQIATAAAINNTNKVAGDVGTLLKNATFKGVGANIDYTPNLRYPGSSRPAMAGISLLHDFIPATSTDQNRLEGNYFFSNNRSLLERTTQSTTYRNEGGNLLQDMENTNETENNSNDFSAIYSFQNKNRQLTINPSFFTKQNTIAAYQQGASYEQAGDGVHRPVNATSGAQKANNKADNLGIKINTSSKQNGELDYARYDQLQWNNLDAAYFFNIGENITNRVTENRFVFYADTLQNRRFHRKYNTRNHYWNQGLTLKYSNLERWLHIRFMEIALTNDFSVNSSGENNMVTDIGEDGTDIANISLINKARITTFNNQYSILLNKSFYRSLFDRFQRTISIKLEPKLQTFGFSNTSQKSFQNINRTYNKVLPYAAIEYRYMRFSVFDFRTSLNFATSAIYPGIHELAPLIDSANMLSIHLGNSRLQPAHQKKMELSVNYNSLKRDNILVVSFNSGLAATNNAFSDSSFYTADGVQKNYMVNVNGNNSYYFNGRLYKAFKFKNENQLMLTLSSDANFSRNPIYINGTRYLSYGQSFNNRLNMDYSFKDRLRIMMSQHFSSFFARQNNSGNENQFRNTVSNSTLSTAIRCGKKLTISTDANYTSTTATGSGNINFIMWNASATCRAMKGNNLEVKLSALDIFRQNKGVSTIANNNTMSRQISNVLQQYFMLTLSYFPRKFGK